MITNPTIKLVSSKCAIYSCLLKTTEPSCRKHYCLSLISSVGMNGLSAEYQTGLGHKVLRDGFIVNFVLFPFPFLKYRTAFKTLLFVDTHYN